MAAIPPHSLNPKGVNMSLWMTRNINNTVAYEPLRANPEHAYDVIVIGGTGALCFATDTNSSGYHRFKCCAESEAGRKEGDCVGAS